MEYNKICELEKCKKSYTNKRKASRFCSKGCATAWRNTNDLNLRAKVKEGLLNSEKLKEHNKKISKNPITQQKRSEATSKQWSNGEKKKEMMKGQKQAYINDPTIGAKRAEKNSQNPEWHKSLSKALQKRWDDDYEGMIQKCIVPTLSVQRSAIEIEYENELIEKGIKYETQYLVENKIYDFYLPDSNTLVEVDGIYWHPLDIYDGKKYDAKPIENYHNDLIKNEIAERNGYKLERIRK